MQDTDAVLISRLTSSSTTKTGNHLQAVREVSDRIASFNSQLADKHKQLADAEAARAADKAAAARGMQEIRRSMNHVLFDCDVMVQASDGSLTPSLKKTLISASRFFKAKLSTAVGNQGSDSPPQQTIVLEATRPAVTALMSELHFPGHTDASTITQTLAFEVIQLITQFGGPDPSDALASQPPNDLMRRAADVFIAAFPRGGSVVDDMDADEMSTFGSALKLAMQQADVEPEEGDGWLADMWCKVIESCAATMRHFSPDALQSDCIAGLSLAALWKIIEPPMSATAADFQQSHLFICRWLLANLAELGCAHQQSGLADEIRQEHATSARIDGNVAITCVWFLRSLLNRTAPSRLTRDKLRARLAQLGQGAGVGEIGEGETEEALRVMLHDALSISPHVMEVALDYERMAREVQSAVQAGDIEIPFLRSLLAQLQKAPQAPLADTVKVRTAVTLSPPASVSLHFACLLSCARAEDRQIGPGKGGPSAHKARRSHDICRR